jgi:hypothetical protein
LPSTLNRPAGIDWVPGLGLVVACPADNVVLLIK